MLDNNERMNTVFYLILVITVLLFITLYICTKKDIPKEKETFTTTQETPVNNETTIDNILSIIADPATQISQYKYIEKLSDIPFYESLLLYGTTFSDKTHYDKDTDIYIPSASRWNNFIKDDEHFTIINSVTNVPSTIKSPTGLQLKNTCLNGISSVKLNETGFDISQFTVTMTIKVHASFPQEVIELFSIALETPNYIKLTLENDDDNIDNILLYSHVGDDDDECKCKSGISIPKKYFLNELTITMAYSKTEDGNSTRYLFINGIEEHKSEPYKLVTDLKLGHTNIIINKYKNLDASLNMFMYHSIALNCERENLKIYDYYQSQKTTIPMRTSFTENVTKEQVQTIRTILNDNTMTQAKIKEELDKCIANKPPPPKEDFKYKVSSIGNVKISDEDIGSCPILNIDTRLTSLDPPQPSEPVVEQSKKITDSVFPFNISLPF